MGPVPTPVAVDATRFALLHVQWFEWRLVGDSILFVHGVLDALSQCFVGFSVVAQRRKCGWLLSRQSFVVVGGSVCARCLLSMFAPRRTISQPYRRSTSLVEIVVSDRGIVSETL